VIPVWSATSRAFGSRRFSLARIAAPSLFAPLLVFAFLCAAAAVLAQPAPPEDTYKLEKIVAPPSADIPVDLRNVVASDAMRVTGPNGILCEVWLRKQIPVAATPSTELGVTFGQIQEGTLLGVMHIPAGATDFREQKIKPGFYTLRYSLHPVDGNHAGIAPQRDFALLSPVANDSDPATISREEALKRSANATGTKHPSVWSLWPADDPGANPTLQFQSDQQIWMLTFRLSLSKGAPLPMGMVVVGHAPEA
jgi:hypothetical protein